MQASLAGVQGEENEDIDDKDLRTTMKTVNFAIECCLKMFTRDDPL